MTQETKDVHELQYCVTFAMTFLQIVDNLVTLFIHLVNECIAKQDYSDEGQDEN